MVTKADIIDPAVADAAFALKAGEVSAPVKGRFGTVLLQVGKIEPGKQKTLKRSRRKSNAKSPRVAPKPKSAICATRLRTNAPPARRSPRLPRSSGSNLAPSMLSTVPAAARTASRSPACRKSPNVIAAAFASDVGVDNDALQLPSGGYL